MNKMFNGYGYRAAAVVVGGMASVSAFALGGPIDTVLATVDFSGVATTIAAAALVIVAIALTFKGPDVAKRLVRKV